MKRKIFIPIAILLVGIIGFLLFNVTKNESMSYTWQGPVDSSKGNARILNSMTLLEESDLSSIEFNFNTLPKITYANNNGSPQTVTSNGYQDVPEGLDIHNEFYQEGSPRNIGRFAILTVNPNSNVNNTVTALFENAGTLDGRKIDVEITYSNIYSSNRAETSGGKVKSGFFFSAFGKIKNQKNKNEWWISNIQSCDIAIKFKYHGESSYITFNNAYFTMYSMDANEEWGYEAFGSSTATNAYLYEDSTIKYYSSVNKNGRTLNKIYAGGAQGSTAAGTTNATTWQWKNANTMTLTWVLVPANGAWDRLGYHINFIPMGGTIGSNPKKTVNKTTARVGDTITYTIKSQMPDSQDPDFYLTSLVMTDKLDTNLEYQSFTVKNESGTDITSSAGTFRNNNGTLTYTFNANYLKNLKNKYDGQVYTYTITAKVKNSINASSVKNNATFNFNNEQTLTTNTVTTNIQVVVDYKIVGDNQPTDCSKPTPGAETLAGYSPYTQKPALIAAGTEEICGTKKCSFKGWNTSSNLTGTWTNGTALSKDLTLYGSYTCRKEVKVYYHLQLFNNNQEGHEDYGKMIPLNSVAPVESNRYWAGDTYTAKPELTTEYDGMICKFSGWFEGSLTGNKYTTKAINNDLNLYGKWDCKPRYEKPEKETDKVTIDLEDEFRYTIKSKVPAMTQEEFESYKYKNYKITDVVEDIVEIGNITVYLNNKNVSRYFIISRDEQVITVEAKSDYIDNIDFYGKTYEIRIDGSIKDYYQENEEKLLEKYNLKPIENKAKLTIDNKWNIDSNKIEQEIKKVKINYKVIGFTPPIDLTDPTPSDKEQTRGTSFTPEPGLETRYLDKICKFDGWYTDKDFTLTWKAGENLYNDLTLFGSWRCEDLINELTKSTDAINTKIGSQYEYRLKNVVPQLQAEQYYKSFEIVDELESVIVLKSADDIKIMAGEEDVKKLFDIIIEGQKVTIKAKDVSNPNFYGKTYEVIMSLYVDKNHKDLPKYKNGNSYIIPNKATLNITPSFADYQCDEEGKCRCTGDKCIKKETPPVEKEYKPIEITYKIISTITPDPKYTDPTPGVDSILPNSKYDAKGKLKTKDPKMVCTFKGWYTDDLLKKQYKDGTVLDEDITLYGAWDCKKVEKPVTPNTVDTIMKYTGLSLLAIGVVATSSFYIRRLNIKRR